MSPTVSRPLKVAKPLPPLAEPVTLTAEPVCDSPAPATPAAVPASETAPVAERSPKTPATYSAAVGLWFWRMRTAFTSGTVSAVVHGAAIIALAVVAASSPGDRRPPLRRLEATVVPAAAKIDVLPKFLPKLNPTDSTVVSHAEATAQGEGSAGSGGGRGGGHSGGVNPAGLNPGKFNSASGGTGFGTDDAFGRHMMGEVGELAEPSTTFFGVKAEGRKFAFVVDTSGSMRINARFLRCRNELLRSLASMTYGQQYFVVFFNHRTFPMPEHKLVDARPGQLQKTVEWILTAVPDGGTEPWQGLQLALRQKPDAIYLLTDGQFDPVVVDKVIAAQPETKKIPIHTIAFESLEGARLLEMISRVTRGQHQYVP